MRQAVSADALFAAVAAWALAGLALAATRRSAAWSILAGLLLGACAMLSYGLPLLGLLATGVLALGRWCPALPIAAVAAVVPVAFAALGFSYLDTMPALRARYYDGVGGRRPASYWMWGDPAALAFSAGPLAAACLAQLLATRQHRRRVDVRSLRSRPAGAITVLVADVTQMEQGGG